VAWYFQTEGSHPLGPCHPWLPSMEQCLTDSISWEVWSVAVSAWNWTADSSSRPKTKYPPIRRSPHSPDCRPPQTLRAVPRDAQRSCVPEWCCDPTLTPMSVPLHTDCVVRGDCYAGCCVHAVHAVHVDHADHAPHAIVYPVTRNDVWTERESAMPSAAETVSEHERNSKTIPMEWMEDWSPLSFAETASFGPPFWPKSHSAAYCQST